MRLRWLAAFAAAGCTGASPPGAADPCWRYAHQPCAHGRAPGPTVDWGTFCRGPASPNAPGSPWRDRSSAAATWVWERPPSFLLDLGAGCLTMGQLIPQTTRYIPSDVYARPQLQHHEDFAGIISCDYNGGLLPRAPPGDANGLVVALGVVEYMCDPLAFLKGLRSYQLPIVVSYAPVQLPMSRGELGVRANGLSDGQWAALLAEAGLGAPLRQTSIVSNGSPTRLYWFQPSPAPWGGGPAANATVPQAPAPNPGSRRGLRLAGRTSQQQG